MKVLILGGFLGSGKTSLLLQLAYYITGHALNDKKYQVVILENEVGEEGIDDKLLRGNGYQVENLFSGCACCTLSGELLSTVSKIEKELQPDYLIQKNLADSMALSSRICIVADASRWERLLVPLHELITGQLINADTVLINKMDLVTPDTLKAVERQIQDMGRVPKIFRTSANQPVSHCIWDFILEGDSYE